MIQCGVVCNVNLGMVKKLMIYILHYKKSFTKINNAIKKETVFNNSFIATWHFLVQENGYSSTRLERPLSNLTESDLPKEVVSP